MNPKKPLSQRELRERLAPMVREVLQDPAMAAAIQPHLQAAADSAGRSYSDLAVEASNAGQPRRRASANDLPTGARTFGRMALAVSLGQGDRSATQEAAKALDIDEAYSKALSAGSAEGGGLLLGEDVANDVIEVLRGMSIVRRADPREIEIPAGTLRTPRIDTGVSSGYTGEGQAIPASEMKTGSVTLIGKKLATLVVLSNELSTFSQRADVDTIVTQDALDSISESEDTAFLTGSGTEHEPAGIVTQTADAHKFGANATVNVSNTMDDLSTAMNLLSSADVPLRRPAWLMAPRTLHFLRTLLNSNGQFVFRDEIERGQLFGWPVLASTHVPTNQGAGSDESFIVAVDMSEVMIGDVRRVAIDRSSEAAVQLAGEADLTSLFQTDRSAIRVRQWNDLVLRHNVSAAVIEAVTWGA